MKIQKIMRWITLILLSIYLIYCSYHFIVDEVEPTYSDCGKVISKSNDEIIIKYGTRTQLYLNVQFNNSGFRSIECDPTTYFSKHVNDEICCNLSKNVGLLYYINFTIGCMVLTAVSVIILAIFISFITEKELTL